MYQNLSKEGNSDSKFLRCPDLLYNKCEVVPSAIALYKVDLDFAATVKAKPTGNDSGFITYSNKINVTSKLLNNSVCLITQWHKLSKEQAILWYLKLGRTKKAIKVGNISEKDDNLIFEEKLISFIGNNIKRSLEMNPGKI